MPLESTLRQRIGRLLKENKFFYQSLEATTAPGLPDMYYRKGVAGWIELKHIKKIPKKATTGIFTSYNHPLSNEQINWISLELAHGGRANILASYENALFLVPGRLAHEFNDLTWVGLRAYLVTPNELLERLIG